MTGSAEHTTAMSAPQATAPAAEERINSPPPAYNSPTTTTQPTQHPSSSLLPPSHPASQPDIDGGLHSINPDQPAQASHTNMSSPPLVSPYTGGHTLSPGQDPHAAAGVVSPLQVGQQPVPLDPRAHSPSSSLNEKPATSSIQQTPVNQSPPVVGALPPDQRYSNLEWVDSGAAPLQNNPQPYYPDQPIALHPQMSYGKDGQQNNLHPNQQPPFPHSPDQFAHTQQTTGVSPAQSPQPQPNGQQQPPFPQTQTPQQQPLPQPHPETKLQGQGQGQGGPNALPPPGQGAIPHQYQIAVPLQTLGIGPAPIDCPNCRQRGMTATTHVSSDATHLWALLFCCLACAPCIAYLVDTFKDVEHRCSKCGILVATWKKSGGTQVHLYQ